LFLVAQYYSLNLRVHRAKTGVNFTCRRPCLRERGSYCLHQQDLDNFHQIRRPNIPDDNHLQSKLFT